MKRLGWAIDWNREVSAHEPPTTAGRSGCSCASSSAASRTARRRRSTGARTTRRWSRTSTSIDGRCERCGTRGRGAEPRAVVLQDHRRTPTSCSTSAARGRSTGPSATKAIQRNWIGRSEGAEILFRRRRARPRRPGLHDAAGHAVRRDLLRLAPEHPLRRAARGERAESGEYVGDARPTTEERADRHGQDRRLHRPLRDEPGQRRARPDLGRRLRADGLRHRRDHGRPAHDERDHEFAERSTCRSSPASTTPTGGRSSAHRGEVLSIGQFDGCDEEAQAIVDVAGGAGAAARPAVNYRLRDWSFSRQRYWGCPIPIVYCDDCGIVPVPEDELPVLLPEVEDYRPKGKPPLASNEEWLDSRARAAAARARREADTMDTFVDSSWYFLRYADPHNDRAPFDREIVDYWLPVDQYIGGIDHATGHLLYARFFVKVLNDLGLVGFREPFARLFHQGWVPGRREDVEVEGQRRRARRARRRATAPTPCGSTSSSWARPTRTWSGPRTGIEGMRASCAGCGASCSRRPRRAARRLEPARWRARPTRRSRRSPTTSGGASQFNTPIAAVMELVNELSRAPDDPAARFAAETAVSLIQPYAPHVAEELWERLGHERLWEQPWPEADRDAARARHVRARRPGERQGARPHRGGGEASEDELVERRRRRRRCRRTSTARRSGRRSSCRASSSTSSSASAVSTSGHEGGTVGATCRSPRIVNVLDAFFTVLPPRAARGRGRARAARRARARARRCLGAPPRAGRSAGGTAPAAPSRPAAPCPRPRRRRGAEPGLYRLATADASPTRSSARAAPRGKADLALVNLAAPVADGTQVVVPRAGGAAPPAAGPGRGAAPVSLSSATVEQLDALPGSARHGREDRVLADAHGAFRSVRRPRRGAGHRPGRLEQLRELVTP